MHLGLPNNCRFRFIHGHWTKSSHRGRQDRPLRRWWWVWRVWNQRR